METKTENSTKQIFTQWVPRILGFELYNSKHLNPNTQGLFGKVTQTTVFSV